MSVQTRTNYTNLPFILSGNALTYEAETVLQDEDRSGAMVKYTVMARVAATRKWVPFTDETAEDGTQIPRGILMADLSEAEIKAGDVVDVPILVGAAITVDENQVVIENSKTLNTVITVPTNIATTVRDMLVMASGIYCEDTINIDGFENS